MHDYDIRPVPIANLMVDPSVQRDLERPRVNKLVGELNLDGIGVISVSVRTNGDHHIIDGQHRIEALRAAGHGSDTVVCRLFSGLTLAQEASMFLLLNNTAKVGAFDKFCVRVVEGDPVAVAVSKIISNNGWILTKGHRINGFHAVDSLERIYKRDATAAELTISTVTSAWGHDRSAVDGRVIGGIGLVYHRYGGAIENDVLIMRLAKFGGGAGALLGRSRGLRDMIGCTVEKAVAEVVVETYNRQKKKNILPPWRS